MNISKQYAWRSADNCRENNPLLPQSLRGLVIGKSGCGKLTVVFNLLLQHGWLDYNHLYVSGGSHHQQEYKVLRKGFEAGLSKQQISNVFNSQEALGDIPPLIVIEKYNGARNGKIRADFYDDCQNTPDPSTLDPAQKNLLLLDNCFLGKQIKAEANYTRGRHNNCDNDMHCSKLFPITSTNNSEEFKLYYPFPTRREESHTVLVRYPSWNSNSFAMRYGVKSTTL